MANLRHIVQCAHINFVKWRRNPMIFAFAVCWFLIILQECQGLRDFCRTFDLRISPWGLPFLLGTFRGTTLLYVSVLIFLFAHAPYSNRHAPFMLVRTGKLSWLLGQALYTVEAALAAALFTYGAMLASLLPYLGFSTDWGTVLETLANQSVPLEEYGITIMFGISKHLITEYSAIEGTLLTLLMMWLTASLIGCVVMVFNIALRPGAGIVTAFVLMTWSFFTNYGYMLLKVNFNLQNTNLFFWHTLICFQPIRSEGLPLWLAIVILIALSLLCVAVSAVLFSRRDVTFDNDEI